MRMAVASERATLSAANQLIIFVIVMILCISNIITIHAATRVYYIAAEEVEWNYLPTGFDCVHSSLLNTNDNITASLSCPTLTNVTSDDDDGSGGGGHAHSIGMITMEHHGSDDDGHNHHATKFGTTSNDGNMNIMAEGNEPTPDHSPSKWIMHGAKRIGRRYIKARYQEYTDNTFTQQKNRTSRETHLGLLGPIIRGVVGDTIHIVFMNRASRPYSIHVHGLLYTKSHEGAPYDDDMNMHMNGDSVASGANYTYVFTVPERAGPASDDVSSVMWLYHSHVDEVADTNAGLFGAIIITRAGWAKDDGSPIDVDREFITSFTVYDETESGYYLKNVQRYLNNSWNPDYSDSWVKSLSDDSEFLDSNEKHAMNGYLYGNVPGFIMEEADRVRWYSFTLGSEEGFHTPHWHGQTLTSYGVRVDTVQVLPATTNTADMVPDNQGMWMYHCHVNHHIHAGMTALFGVTASTKPIPHTEHNEPVQGWIWFVIFLILAIPMSIFGGLFAKTYLKQSPVQLSQSTYTPPQPTRSASVSARARQQLAAAAATANGHSSPHSSAAPAAADNGRDNRAPVVVSRAKITAYSPTSPTEAKITEKRGMGLASAVTSLPTATNVLSPLPSPPYQLATDSPLPITALPTRPSSGSVGAPPVLVVHAEPLPLAVAAPAPATASHQMVVAVDMFEQRA